MKALKTLAIAALLISMSTAFAASVSGLQEDAAIAIQMIESNDHDTREKGREKLEGIKEELAKISVSDSDHDTREKAREALAELEGIN